MPDVWSHDKFAEAPAARGLGGAARGGTGKLMISNLDFGVNDSDINVRFFVTHIVQHIVFIELKLVNGPC